MRSVWRNHYCERFKDLAFITSHIRELVDANHESGDDSIERDALDVLFFFLNKFMQRLELFFCCLVIRDLKLTFFINEQFPELTQEAVNAFNALGIPWF